MKALKLIGTLGWISLPVLALAAEEHKVSVTGICNRSSAPDRAAITLVADVRDNDLRNASRKVSEIYGRTRDAVERLKLDEIELRTSDYSVQQVRDWENGKSVFKGYQARMGLRVSSSAIARMGEVIAIATREGVQDVGALVTYLSPDKQLKEQVACLEEAAKNARAKAERLAAALGAKVGPAISLQESWAPVPRPIEPMGMAMAMSRDLSEPAPKVEGGKQEISVTVYASFQLLTKD